MNQIDVIYPFRKNGLWVFTDRRVGLEDEPFIAGADDLIDRALIEKGIPLQEAAKGFRLFFSANPFPMYDMKLDWVRHGDGGDYYRSERFDMEGWLCPALLLYYKTAPTNLYVKVERE